MTILTNKSLLQPVTRWSGWAANGCLVLAALFIGGTVYKWSSADPQSLQMDLAIKHAMLSTGRRLICLALALLPTSILSLGLFRLRGSFRSFARGELFSHRAIAGLKEFAAASAASVIVAAAASALISLVVTWESPDGAEAALSVGTGSVTLLLVSMLTWIFGHILGLGAQLAQENDAFV